MNQIQSKQSTNLQTQGFSEEVYNVIRSSIAKDATPVELQHFLIQCQRTGLDPITRQIYFIKDNKGKVQIQTSIDGFRLIAERSGQYEGQTAAQWCGPDGTWKDVWLSKELPAAAKVGVYKKGFREALYAVAIFDECAQRKFDGSLNYMWNKMPALMLAKVAESQALRKAFPNEMSGLYTSEEMGTEPAQERVESLKAPVTVPVKQAQVIEPILPNEELKDLEGARKAKSIAHALQYGTPYEDAIEETGTTLNSVNTAATPNVPQGIYVIEFGKYKGKTLFDLGDDAYTYAKYLKSKAEEEGKEIKGVVKRFLDELEKISQ